MFTAEIDSDTNKLLWAKSILAISLFSEFVKISISNQKLQISGINQTQSNHGEITFQPSFFTNYSCDSPQTLMINSQHLSIIFKNFDITSSISFSLRDHQYKFLINVTKKLIIKKYQINFQPVESDINLIDNYSGKFGDDDSIHRLVLDQSVVKNFIDMIPSQTEEFRLEINDDKITFQGFTKQILKDNSYLKQPMLLTISLNVDDRHLSGVRVEYTFKLKFLRIFINLIAKVDVMEFYFKDEGDHISFVHRGDVEVRFDSLVNEGKLPVDYKVVEVTDKEREVLTRENLRRESVRKESLRRENVRSYGQTQTTQTSLWETPPTHPTNLLGIEIDQFQEEEEYGPTQTNPVRSIFDGL